MTSIPGGGGEEEGSEEGVGKCYTFDIESLCICEYKLKYVCYSSLLIPFLAPLCFIGFRILVINIIHHLQYIEA